ncbi:hypothetical protein [Microcoleus sp. F4-D5]|uniref:hypothetical protein n=1 Tax=Microcoleus sp. F4-D5 TaxID=2818760 RepID=UPI002FD2AF60
MSYSQHFRLLQNLFYKTFLVSLDSLRRSVRSSDCRFDRLSVGSIVRLSARSSDCQLDRPIVSSIVRLSARSSDCQLDRSMDVAIG